MATKRKRQTFEVSQGGDGIVKPAAGTRSFPTGKSVKEALSTHSRQAITSFHQQILTPYASLPLDIKHPTILILQHYLDLSPTVDEIFTAWKLAEQNKDEKLGEAAVALLVELIQVLTPVPFFRQGLLGIVRKVISQTEGYAELLNRMVQSAKRDQSLLGIQLAAALVHVDPLDPAAPPGSSGRLALGVWACLSEGGSVRGLGKMLGMRRRNKEGTVAYGPNDPLNRPDIRHAILHFLLPFLSSPSLHAHSRSLLPQMYSNLPDDPPITILRVLTALYNAMILPSPGIARKNSLALLDESALENLLRLVEREDAESTTGRSVGEMARGFLEQVTCVPGRGVCFRDEGWYPRKERKSALEDVIMDGEQEERRGRRGDDGRKGLHNRILSNAVRKLGNQVVDGKGYVGEWARKVMTACPEIVAGYWAHSALAVEPRLSAKWFAIMSHISQIISQPPPPASTFHQPMPRAAASDPTLAPPRSTPPAVDIMVESILPSPLLKVFLTKGLSHADGLVQHTTALTLARGLQKLSVVQDLLLKMQAQVDSEPGSSTAENAWAKARRDLELECRRRVPEPMVIIAFAQKSATLARPALGSEEDAEVDPALVAKSAMLTEAALRLFRLYHSTLPSLVAEAKFDVGRLLVSSSSAKQERRERQAAKQSGSVIGDRDERGSVMSMTSVGSAGTAGMGGGFGAARGEVKGFEAMCQGHVLSLLGAVDGWQWTNKASGSQFTYMYHLLLLHLTTPHPTTFHQTTSLLHALLDATLLFEHDPCELDIWLDALPRLSDPSSIGVEAKAKLYIQQVNLLAFIDDCIRRAMRTPYRYIEELLSLAPVEEAEYYDRTQPAVMPSLLLMVVLEQLEAKLLGQHISTDSARGVMQWLRRVMLGLMGGKGKDGRAWEEVVGRLDKLVAKSVEGGLDRKGLKEVAETMEGDWKWVFPGTGSSESSTHGGRVEEEESLRLLDEDEWRRRSFERQILDGELKPEEVVRRVEEAGDVGSVERRGRFVLRLIEARQPDEGLQWVKALQVCLSKARSATKGSDGGARLRSDVFESESIKGWLLEQNLTDAVWQEMDGLVGGLDSEASVDRALSDVYVREILGQLDHDKKGKRFREIMTRLHPWTDFLEPPQAAHILGFVARRPKALKADATERVAETLERVVAATRDVNVPLQHLETLLQLGIIRSLTELLHQHSALVLHQPLKVPQNAMKVLSATDTPGSIRLLVALVEVSPSAARDFATIVQAQPQLVENEAMLPAVASVLELPSAIDKHALAPRLATRSIKAIGSDRGDAALRIIELLAEQQPESVVTAVSKRPAGFGAASAWLLQILTEASTRDELSGVVDGLLKDDLEWAVRQCSEEGELDEAAGQILKILGSAVTQDKDIEVPVELSENVITAISQERLEDLVAMEFAIVLAERCALRASFIRTHLQHLFASRTYASLTSASSSTSAINRDQFIHLVTTLFHTSPYASCQPSYIEPLLPLYHGTMTLSDRRILGVWQMFERYRNVSVGSILVHWTASGIPGSGSGRALDALTSLEAGKVFNSCMNFPLRRQLAPTRQQEQEYREELGDAEKVYDPVLVLSLLGCVLREGLSGLDWVEVLRSNALGLAVCSLASRDDAMRAMGGYVLAKSLDVMQSAAFQEKPQFEHTLMLLRHAVPAPSMDPAHSAHPRLPTLTTLFVATALRALANPGSNLYPLTSRFLLQRSTLDMHDPPMLFQLLFSREEDAKRERGWIVRLLRDGVRSEADWRILKRRNTLSLLLTLFSSSTDLAFRRLILQAIESFSRIPAAGRGMVLREGMISWMGMQWGKCSREEKRGLLRIVQGCLSGMMGGRPMGETGLDAGKGEEVGETNDKKQGGWARDVEGFIKLALPGADPERHASLSDLSLRLALLSHTGSSQTARDLLPALVTGGTSADDATVETLFRLSLTLGKGQERVREVREALGELWERVGNLDGEVGNWVRREARRAEWEAFVVSEQKRKA